MQKVADDPRFKRFFENMDYADVKTITADVGLRQFIAGMLSYQPWWLTGLYRVREILVKGLGLVEHDLPDGSITLKAEDISFTPGDNALFFIVRAAEEECFWIAETPPDNHLTAFFGVVTLRSEDEKSSFGVFTTVRYIHWTGPVYFNLIRPFHHLVVDRMMRAAAVTR